jgi:hypothetical protein
MSKALYIKGTDNQVASLTDDQLGDLVRLLEEEHAGDRDYYIDGSVVGYLEERGCDKALVGALRRALGARGMLSEARQMSVASPEEGLEVEWRED